eukprot:1782379-Rhodomonas_salina.1
MTLLFICTFCYCFPTIGPRSRTTLSNDYTYKKLSTFPSWHHCQLHDGGTTRFASSILRTAF